VIESIALELKPPVAGNRRAPDVADRAVAVLQAVAEPIRWAVLDELGSGEQCVCVLQERIPIAANLLSYHLKVLREAGLVVATRRGRWIDYSLAVDAADRIAAALPRGVAERSGGSCCSMEPAERRGAR